MDLAPFIAMSLPTTATLPSTLSAHTASFPFQQELSQRSDHNDHNARLKSIMMQAIDLMEDDDDEEGDLVFA